METCVKAVERNLGLTPEASANLPYGRIELPLPDGRVIKVIARKGDSLERLIATGGSPSTSQPKGVAATPTLAPQSLRAFVRRLRFARRNAGFVPTTVTKSLGGVTFGRGTFQPGWRWSTSVKPLVVLSNR